VAGAAGGTVDGGEEAAAEGDGSGAEGIGGAAAEGDGSGAGDVDGASLDCRKMCSLTKELTDDIAVSAPWRTAVMTSKYPATCWPTVTTPRMA
jgi:hypothetical protein